MDHPSNTSPAPSNAFNSRLALVMRQLDDVKAENRSLKERLERLEAGESEARNIIFRVGQRLAEIEDTFHSTASRQGISDGAVAATVMLDDKREKRAELQRENRVAACIAHMKHAARYRVPESERSHDTGGRGATISTSDRGEASKYFASCPSVLESHTYLGCVLSTRCSADLRQLR